MGCEPCSPIGSVELVTFELGIPLLRLKRCESLEMCEMRLRSTKSGRSVTRHAQRMASAGSIWDL